MPRTSSLITPVLVTGCLITLVSFAIRASFGVFQIPIAEEFGWARAEFSLALAFQNLAWGIGQPIFGAIAERMGERKAVVIGILLYALGLVLSAGSVTPLGHQAWNWMIGFGIAGSGFGLILAIVARAASEEHRSMAMAITTAAGSAGQVVGAPVAEWLLSLMNWSQVFLVFAGAMLVLLMLVPGLKAPEGSGSSGPDETLGEILGRALRDPSFTLIFLGFFSCGYQLGFITSHFPALVTEMCGPIAPGSVLHGLGVTTTSALGAVAISLIGLANIAGTLLAGWAGKHYPRKYLLAGVYAGRTLFAGLFILFPITPGTVLLFSAGMGALWLATVPLTSGLVGHIYGLRYLGTLYGLVFFSHQLGSFLGIWLGGRMYDAFGDYTLVWWVGVGIGAFSAIVHLPVREQPLARPLAA
ncbi:MFS transporter [Marinibacterium profundimaris]|uniref:MFS transporter n=1 Tax=Marinibacterium profundimaris TaxID=1679460 RepID=A0A225NT81_9RHOB|nr:MFS transporter [Marinibacterium profundimaris]OWU76018.1 MFS transporter [Marinibacterium profundimaris]